MDTQQLKELLLQALEHERGGVRLYEVALQCAQNEDLKGEWEKYLEETRNHVRVLENVFQVFGLETEEQSPGRKIVATMGADLLGAIEEAREAAEPAAAQLVAAECIVLAETKDHMNWELLGACVPELKGEQKKVLKDAYDEIEDQEDEHLYHTRGWCRELWLESLGLKAMLPPPEERQHVKTAIEAARAEQSKH